MVGDFKLDYCYDFLGVSCLNLALIIKFAFYLFIFFVFII